MTLQDRSDVLIVGAGHAGAQMAQALRQRNFPGTIRVLGAEHDLPYERPPLSKDYLAGDKPFDRMLIRPPSFWLDRKIDIRTRSRVVAVDPAAKTVKTAGGELYPYGTLIWATGGEARRLTCPGSNLAGIHVVRTNTDVDLLRAELGSAHRILIIGAGFIGLEVAAVLAKAGKQVTVLEAQDRVLARVTGPALSRFYETEHRNHGVDVRTNVKISALHGESGRVNAVELANGTRISADLVVVGIGIDPAVAPLKAAGAAGHGGVDVDALCRTSLRDVFAIGDCAARENPYVNNRRIRVESVQNANDQAIIVAKLLTGTEDPAIAVPTFWSNQYDLKLQTVGISDGHDNFVIRGSMSDRSFSVIYYSNSKIIALDCINSMRDYVQGRQLIQSGSTSIDPAKVADTSVQLKDMAHNSQHPPCHGTA